MLAEGRLSGDDVTLSVLRLKLNQYVHNYYQFTLKVYIVIYCREEIRLSRRIPGSVHFSVKTSRFSKCSDYRTWHEERNMAATKRSFTVF
jgi:hypothetical protein